MTANRRSLALLLLVWWGFALVLNELFPLFRDGLADMAELFGLDWAVSFFSIFVLAGAVLLPLMSILILHWTGSLPALTCALTPTSRARARNRAGVALCKRGGYVAAIAEFTEAVRLDPDLAIAIANRAAAYHHLGKQDEALADYNEALRRQPNLLPALTARALIWAQKQDSARALDDTNRALALGAQEGILYAIRGSIALAREDYDHALTDCTEAILRGSNGAGDFSNRGMAWLGKGEYERAIADFNKAIQRDTRDGLAFNNRGVAFLKQGAYTEARADFQEAMRLSPALPNSYKNLAWLLATCPEPEFRDGISAVGHAQKALQLVDHKVIEWFGILAAAYAEAGNFEEAIKWQAQCLNGSPAKSKKEMEHRLALYERGQPYRENLDRERQSFRPLESLCSKTQYVTPRRSP